MHTSKATDRKFSNFFQLLKSLHQRTISIFPKNCKQIVTYQIYNPVRYALDLNLSRLREIDIAGKPTNKLIRTLIVSDGKNYTSETQFAPLRAYRKELKQRFGFVFKQMLIEDTLHRPHRLKDFDVIFVKLSFMLPTSKAQQIIRSIHAAKGSAKLVYFDGDDDLCIQWPEIFPYLDLYVKKHLFVDLEQYGKTFVGKNNLTDYVASRWGVSFTHSAVAFSKPLASEQRHKLFLGYNIGLDNDIRKLCQTGWSHKQHYSKENDIVCRIPIDPNDWKYYLRHHPISQLQTLSPPYRILASTERTSQQEYFQEMLNSKICVSPFGYGEICWRDFEAVLCRCLLIKPDMGHVQTTPDIFVPYDSYVPVKWNYSDLEEKCIYYLQHPNERERIVQRAYQQLTDYYRSDAFMDKFAELLERIT